MQYDFRGSNPSGVRNGNGNLSGLSRNGYPSPSAMETGPGVVPIQVYQQVAEELESARQQVSQLSAENQRLRSLHQQLSGEIAGISQEFQGQLGHTLKRLQQIGQAAQAAAASEGGSQPFQPTRTPDPSPPEAPPTYDFLNRLKRRQTGNGTSSFPSNSYPETYTPGFSAPFETPPRPAPSRPEATVPGFARPRHDTPAESYPRAGYQVPSLDELMQDMGGSDPYAEAYPTGVYQRVRDQHHGSQGSTVLWMAAAVILVIGSFGLGFVAVQPFLRNDPPPPPVQAP
ncbi:hypothetical protein L1047_00070 [Synechococcus sp. Nb3U1]|uniref:hypothetical protein n=1 Tax=Synechococcus sp. Nb3U1 TaxID=1914529 RepID=UPI001F3F3A72|nr:hypothetical protein [Synechococcus sp. Nb3U1]MCF2969594.1 hypothetical protein [Synechococcus sp. Nb3U1]